MLFFFFWCIVSKKSLGSLPADCPILCVVTIGDGISTVFLANPFGSGVVAKGSKGVPEHYKGSCLSFFFVL
ncbi:MAG: hypothetical protein EBS53_11145 [Bacteroidetes bacterium]|nr:hypothetical protein [Bacteroidota bacterium]